MRMGIPNLQKIEDDFKERVKEIFGETGTLEPELSVFPQVWESTALGFEGFGGQAITTAYTTVAVEPRHETYAVFFDNSFAYILKAPNHKFFRDLTNHRMARVAEYKNYEEQTKW